jgi:hypothetical protein
MWLKVLRCTMLRFVLEVSNFFDGSRALVEDVAKGALMAFRSMGSGCVEKFRWLESSGGKRGQRCFEDSCFGSVRVGMWVFDVS